VLQTVERLFHERNQTRFTLKKVYGKKGLKEINKKGFEEDRDRTFGTGRKPAPLGRYAGGVSEVSEEKSMGANTVLSK